ALNGVDTRPTRRSIMRISDARVIHQDVKLAEVRLDADCRRRDGLSPCDVQFDKSYVESFAPEGVRGFTACRRDCVLREALRNPLWIPRATSKPMPCWRRSRGPLAHSSIRASAEQQMLTADERREIAGEVLRGVCDVVHRPHSRHCRRRACPHTAA